jgi:SAM-dependent methyltransferase
MDGPRRDLHEGNRLSWNIATDAHNSHKGDQAAFYRDGGNKLFAEERELLGDVSGKRIVHLQCNSGQDTLSLVQMGAVATGVDISDSAIGFARTLSADSGVKAEFIRSDVYDWLEQAVRDGEQFDVVFCSYGAIIWLSDLEEWGRGIAGILKPGGQFVVVDFHPMSMCFDDDWTLKFPYSGFGGDAVLWVWEDGVGDYVATEMTQADPDSELPGLPEAEFSNPHPSYEFNWGIADILGALMRAGLSITEFREYPYSNSGHMVGMRQNADGKWVPPPGTPPVPLMYGIRAEKP